MANISKIKIDGTSYSLTDDTKVSINSTTGSVYTTGTSQGSVPYTTQSNTSGSLIQRDGDGKAYCESGTDDKNIVNYSQMVNYVSEHSGGGGGLSLHKTYDLGNGTSSYTITDSEVWEALVTNAGLGCQMMISGLTAYTHASQPFGMVFNPFYCSSAYKPTYQYETSAHLYIGDSNDYVYVTLTYNTTDSSITIKSNNMTTSGSANNHTIMYRIEIIKF